MSGNPSLRIALAQINSTVGDLDGNCQKIIEGIEQAKSIGCDLVAFPELTISGYPPEDLLLRRQFVLDQKSALEDICCRVQGIVSVIGFVESENGKLFNSAAIVQDQALKAIYHKTHLPNYSVFDEERYFTAGEEPLVVTLNQVRIGISICEDIWIPESVVETEAFCSQAEILLNISASPYHESKGKERNALMETRARRTQSIVAYLNLVGGQDELVFDGNSFIFSAADGRIATGKAFAEDFVVADIDVERIRKIRTEGSIFSDDAKAFRKSFKSVNNVTLKSHHIAIKPPISGVRFQEVKTPEAEIYSALVLGLEDYVGKNKFDKVTLGLSGGIDSALVATIAVDALGKEKVLAISMPSHFSSQGSIEDAVRLTENLGIKLIQLPIKPVFDSFLEVLAPVFGNLPPDITEENLQARIRGILLMALSNKFRWLVLTTGNKSEVSVGYCTIYGDTVGGFAPLKDVLKTTVYKLCAFRNKVAGYDLIPRAIIDKPPSAELKPDQTDQDTLPPYELLDSILELYIEQEMGVAEIVTQGYDAAVVGDVARLVDVNEYKRRQAAPGPKITPRAFGKDRRMPITNGYLAR